MTDDSWVPDTCTLPTTERPLRLAEFDGLFRDPLRGADRLSAGHLRLRLDGRAEPVARDLIARESACCSFFTFDLARPGGDTLTLDIRVPANRVAVLDALALRATAARGR
ncbi:hypothetical protein J5U46_11730 [Micromonospora tulbaghiae]|uniref:Arsenate reductase n=1 Tax=Micromonospora tulbaghiae TaxID=479978 RepID=A0AAW4JPS5_9ACTN|nr:hypothetical protein [Micromonospora tulbaghiae]MBO4140819.1 hypothetical protein [Micromonospora tulbaghiae]MDX5461157.1 hypothetical protein [Micromonospora tulbaghiae]SCF16799.1 hypothetical protein GA0070562_0841 [Micromonospora tulbaghiae]